MKIIIAFCLSFVFNGCSSQMLYKTPSGEKYHLANCRMVENVSQQITIGEAKELGLTACSICKPANIYAGKPSAVSKAQGEDKGVQCNGETKKGQRCKHYTRIANGYCYQHQPG